MNRAELIESIANETGFTKADAERALESTLRSIQTRARKESVQLVGFGTFSTVTTKARTGRNPQTGASLKIPSRRRFKFKASRNPKY